MNKFIWQFHSWMGLIAGVGLLLIGVTGSLLVFHDELETAVAPAMFRVRATTSARLPLDALVAAVEAALPDCVISSWSAADEPGLADRFYVVKRGRYERLLVTINPYSGALLGGPLDGQKTLTGRVMALHYTLFAGPAGILAAGLLGVLLCLLAVSGIWIYREFWTQFIRLRWRASWQIFLSDLHKTVGITFMLFYLILGFTGAYWNIPSAIQQFRYSGAHPPELPARLWAHAVSIESLMERARAEFPDFRVTFIGFPAAPGGNIQVYGHTGSRIRSEYCTTVMFDGQTGAIKGAREIHKGTLWNQIVDTFRPLHYGTFGGLFVKVLWCVGGLTPGLLALTGFLLWRKRSLQPS